MIRRRLIIGALVVAAFQWGGLASGLPAGPPSQPAAPGDTRLVARRVVPAGDRRWVPGEVLVRFRDATTRAHAVSIHAALGASLRERIPSVGVDVLRLPRRTSVREAVAAYGLRPEVATVEPNWLSSLAGVTPNDPRLRSQWALHNTGQAHGIADPPPDRDSGTPDADIDAPEAWGLQQGSRDTVIAVLDSGVDVSHPDLAGNVWANAGEVPGNGSDDDGNGYVDDVNGWDFTEDDDTLLEPDGSILGSEHGTHVAGVAAADTDNSTGIAGVCPACRIMVLKAAAPVINEDGDLEMLIDMASQLEAIDYAVAMGADIINGSLARPLRWSRFERDSYRRAGRAGVLAVLAAGNERLDNDMLSGVEWRRGHMVPISERSSPSYPASYNLPAILSVAASNHDDEYGGSTGCTLRTGDRWRCLFTNWGRESVDLAAPGVDILGTVPGGGYGYLSGTSSAAPHAAGVAGLIESQNPNYDPLAVKNAMLNSVRRPDSLSVLPVPEGSVKGHLTATNGAINARRALSASPAVPQDRSDGDIGGAQPLTGFVRWPDDVNDVYKQKLVAGARYRVTLDGPAGRDLNLAVWKPGTTEIWQVESGCFVRDPAGNTCQLLTYKDGTGADKAAKFTATRTDAYYFHVSAAFLSKGLYSLQVRRAD